MALLFLANAALMATLLGATNWTGSRAWLARTGLATFAIANAALGVNLSGWLP